MKVRVLTPTEIVLEAEAAHVTTEDGTGSVGIRPGHAPLVTALVPGVVTVREPSGTERHVAVNGGVLLVRADTVEIVSRQAVAGEDMRRLEDDVVADFERRSQDDKTNRAAFEKLRVSFMRGIIDFDRADEP